MEARQKIVSTITPWGRVLRSRLLFCTLLAASLVGCRLLFFDYEMFFSLQYIPNHDMLAGAPFFCTNMHSLRTGGEIAWWNPVNHNGLGYAQYYQSFLSPVAPTPGSLPFIVWGQSIRVLGWAGVSFPEYRQYLVFTYILLPFLTFFWFGFLASLLFRRRAAVLLVSIGFAFSGVGMWYSAWLYFQEPATLFFFLSAWVLFFRRPTVPRGMLLLAAILVQAASVNYWTIHNSWFIAILLVSHAVVNRDRYRRAWSIVRHWAGRHRWTATAVGTLSTASVGLWLILIASTAGEQMDRHYRSSKRNYVKDEALNRVQETRWYTVEMFNPSLKKALESYPIINPVHNARYIGIVFLPLLACLPFVRWGRRERWLAASAAGVLCVCFAPPFLLSAWEVMPGMNRIIHLFYMYSHLWQVMVILLAGASLDRILRGPMADVKRRVTIVAASIMGITALGMVWLGLESDHYKTGSSAMEGASRAGLLMLVFGGLLWKVITGKAEHRSIFAGVMVVVAFSDLSRYYFEVNRADHGFTRLMRAHIPYPLPADCQSKLKKVWRKSDRNAGFEGDLSSVFPMETELWPHNLFLLPHSIAVARERHEESLRPWEARPSVRFFADKSPDEAPPHFRTTLILNDGASPSLAPCDEGFECRFTRWRYSDFNFEVDVPSEGWLRLYSLPDPLWEIRVDGKRVEVHQANNVCSAIQVSPGKHRVEMTYQPLARKLYGPACVLLVFNLLAQGFIAWRFRRVRRKVESPRIIEQRVAVAQSPESRMTGGGNLVPAFRETAPN